MDVVFLTLKVFFFTTTLIINVNAADDNIQKLTIDNDICRLFKNDVILRKPGTCHQAIKCVNFESIDLEDKDCTGDKPFYNMNTKVCEKTTSDAYCKEPCVTKSPTYVTDKKNCEGWYQCLGNVTKSNGYCPSNMHFNEASQMCIFKSESNCIAEYKLCDIVPTNVPFKDEFNCHKYFECGKKGTLETVTCANKTTYFDAASGKCIAKAQVNCYKHPYPENVCGTTKLNIRNRFVRDQATCRGYFYCRDLEAKGPDSSPNWGQCPFESFFDEKEQACLPRTHVKCDEDRCDGRSSGKELSELKGCQHYFVCSNNNTIEEAQCQTGWFFDGETGECVSSTRSYPVCK